MIPLRPRVGRLLLLLLLPATGAACSSVSPALTSTAPSPEGRLITAEEIRETGATNAWDVLKRAGTHIRMGENQTGTATRMTYRGKSSLLLNDSPMLVIDGVTSRDFQILQHLPAANLFSIRILSGTVGTQFYGTGAAGGTIVIETRKGSEE